MSSMMRGVGFIFIGLLAWACGDGGSGKDPITTEDLPVILQGVDARTILPGSKALVLGTAFISDGKYTGFINGDVDGRSTSLDVALRYIDDQTLEMTLPSVGFSALGEGLFGGTLTVNVATGPITGTGSVNFQMLVVQTLTPSVGEIAQGVFPASPVRIRGGNFISGDEGETLIALRGTYTPEDGSPQPLDNLDGITAAQPPSDQEWERDSLEFTFLPEWVGIKPGRIQGEIKVINRGQGWQREGNWLPIDIDLLPPVIENISTNRASRGQAVRIMGQGFVGGNTGGLTTLRLHGVFTAKGHELPLGAGGLEITPEYINGNELLWVIRVNYDFECRSRDLGAIPGIATGSLIPEIEWNGTKVEGAPLAIRFEILPTKQVVYLKFLDLFTDTLRQFGLRNVSREVQDRIIEVVRRDYAGINLEVRLTEPTDFIEYAVVEIGGPDPNAQQLFGLDNTTGLDRCNQRLDDLLAGQNADSDGAYGGVFVESFLQLSPANGASNPLASPIFDEIFDPTIAHAVEAGEFPGGGRDLVIERAIRTLGNLVGNTITHEVGHSLGLPVLPGCGQYHNPPGERQIMDCGSDRPFHERAELEIGGQAVWTGENRAYLERILPLP